MLNHWPSVYSSICLSIDLSQTGPCSTFKCWVCQDKNHNMGDCVRNPTHPDPPTTGSSSASLPVAGPVTTSNLSSVVNYTRGPVSSLSDAFRCTPTVPRSPEWNPVDAAAHLHLLGEALSLIGLHLKGTNVRTILLFCGVFLPFFLRIFYWKMFIQMNYWPWCTIVNSAI